VLRDFETGGEGAHSEGRELFNQPKSRPKLQLRGQAWTREESELRAESDGSPAVLGIEQNTILKLEAAALLRAAMRGGFFAFRAWH
jgi:hypothetical protein